MKALINKKWSGYRNFAAVAVCLVALAAGCQKAYELDLPLAVTSNEVNLAKEAGSTHIMVYSTGKWTATLTEDVKWASINKLSGEGSADIVFDYSANYGISRKVGVVLVSGSISQTVMLVQEPGVTEAALNFTDRSATLIAAPSTVTVGLTTNVRYNVEDMKVKVTYEGDEEEDGGTGEGSASATGWISDISFDASSLTFSASKLAEPTPRIGYITLYMTNAQDEEVSTTLTVTQTSAGPQLSMTETEGLYFGVSQKCAVPVETNLLSYANQIGYTVTYEVPVPEGEEWIRNAALTGDGLVFNLTQNDSGAMRKATIGMSFTDSEGNAVSAAFNVSQRLNPVLTPFQTYRDAGTAAGYTVTDPQAYIEGIVISDPASANVCMNPQTAQFMFDWTENAKTAYIESADGKYGFCLKFAAEADNTLKRYSKVQLCLNGATIVKEENPTRYTIGNLTAGNIFYAADPDASKMPVKNKTVAQLTDDDVFTWVSLQNIEIVFKDGAYSNLTDGYTIMDAGYNPQGTATAPRIDAAPLLMTDSEGSTIYMNINMRVPWRRNNSGLLPGGVPKGAGTFHGVIVHDEMVRYGDLGRYQIRAMAQSDIALGDTPFSKTIAEWNWNNKTNDLVPETGAGTFEPYGGTTALTGDYNSVLSNANDAATNQKGVLANQAITLTKAWWDFTGDVGRYFDIEFSTDGLSGTNMTFGFTWNHGLTAATVDSPGKWKLLYSIDGGTTFKDVPGAGAIENRSMVWWTTTTQDSCPGFRDWMFKLPGECFGQTKVIVRVQVADKTTDISPALSTTEWWNNVGVGKGTLTDKSTAIRIGALTVRYN